ncbi:MAG: hypothetical protein ABI895_33345 [Deltaproteobacteria bacterium]
MIIHLHSYSRAATKTLGRPHWTAFGLLLVACNGRLAVLDPPLETANAGASGSVAEPTPVYGRVDLDGGVYDDGELAKAAAENVLVAHCGPCHGPALSQAQAPAGINFIGDIDQLVVAGLIVPLSSATSRIVVVMRDGSMPPPGVDAGPAPAPAEGDIETVAWFIDNPRYWPDSSPPAIVDAGSEAPAVDAGAH